VITIGGIKGKVRVVRVQGRAAIQVLEPMTPLTDDQVDDLILLLRQAKTVTRR
jgi:hypothetical protein